MSKLDSVFEAAAKAFGPIIDAQMDKILPRIVEAVVKVLEAQLPKITEQITKEISDQLPRIIEGSIRAIVPDVIETSFPVDQVAAAITKQFQSLLGNLGGLGNLLRGR